MSNFSLRQWEHFHNPYYPDRPCHWTVFNHETNQSIKFNFKHDAIVYQRLLPHATIYFHWYEQEFSRINANIEPVETHDELCRQRAQELRNTYKYLRFWFSGGSDSQTALNSFVNNNIFLDEIVIAEFPDGDNNVDQTATTKRETELAASPALKKIAHLIPNTKITRFKSDSKDADEWFTGSEDPATIPSFDTVDGNLGYALVGAWAFCKVSQRIDHDDFCDISGGSKVKLFKNKDRWYFYFVDASLNDMHNSNHHEDFFISRNIPTLYLKTVYLLKQFFTSQNYNDQQVNDFYSDTKMHRLYNLGMGRAHVPDITTFKMFYITHDPVTWKDNFISAWNSKIFYDNTINTKGGKRWKENYDITMRAILAISGDEWNVDKFGNPVPTLGRKGCLSKFYCLNDGLAYDSTQAKQSTMIQIGI